VGVKVEESAVEGLVGFVCEEKTRREEGRCKLELESRERKSERNRRTVAIPLSHPLILHQNMQVPHEDDVHVRPDPTKVPQHQQPHEISVDPSSLIRPPNSSSQSSRTQQQLPSPFQSSSSRQLPDIYPPNLEPPRIRDEKISKDWRKSLEISVRPDDENGVVLVLSGEEGFDGPGLTFLEGEEVGSPVGVVVGFDERDERTGSKGGGVGEAVVLMGEGDGRGE